MYLLEDARDAQVSRCILQRHDVEMVVRERKLMNVGYDAIDAQAPVLRALLADLLHSLAAVDGVHFQARLALQ